MKILKGLGKLLAVCFITAVMIWMLHMTVQGMVIGTYKEGIRAGYNACQEQTGVLLDTRGREVENWTPGYRNEPQ